MIGPDGQAIHAQAARPIDGAPCPRPSTLAREQKLRSRHCSK
jgi:hypothetical protein